MAKREQAGWQAVAHWLIEYDIAVSPKFVAENLICGTRTDAERCLERLSERGLVERNGDGFYQLTNSAQKVRGEDRCRSVA